MKKKYIFIILFCLLLILIDFISKYLVINLINDKVIIIIKNFLKFLYVKNTGAAFGIMSGNIIILVIVTLILLFYID